MSQDLEKAISLLPGHSLVLVKDEETLFSDLKGVAPMMSFLEKGADLKWFSAADLVIGKAAASLFVKAGIKDVYGQTMSEKAAAYLKEKGVTYSYGLLVPDILNAKRAGLCPMEDSVKDIDDPDEAHEALKQRIALLKSKIKPAA